MFYISPLAGLDCPIKRLAINISSLTGLELLTFWAKPRRTDFHSTIA
jgi:hypothetical protein